MYDCGMGWKPGARRQSPSFHASIEHQGVRCRRISYIVPVIRLYLLLAVMGGARMILEIQDNVHE